ncbi:MAG TPA: CmpA/NrtA family ABC transporter substrate-binding protein [Roseimicrobium sp.]|nr:CmpA/NrtA family ABC transporter substrate-binding protein [Roseimicrobium sp.]
MVKPQQEAPPTQRKLRGGLHRIRLGFVPLTDCAPLIVAQERGYFARYDLKVDLSRELGWATIRDKIIYGDLDAAHAVAGMPIAATFGLGSIPCPCVTGLVLNLHGNAITLSTELHDRGVRDVQSLKTIIDQDRGTRMYTFGVVYPFSSHSFLLRQWLRSGKIEPDRDVRIVVVPPPQMFANLKAGNLDGYCVGEPWNSLAINSGGGWCVTTSSELSPLHPEKVLMVRQSFADQHAGEHVRLVAALIEACEFCDKPENREEIASLLARPAYLNLPVKCVLQSLLPSFDYGFGRVLPCEDFHLFHRQSTNEPSADKAAWTINHFMHSGVLRDPSVIVRGTAQKVFRMDIYDEGRRLFEECRRPSSLARRSAATAAV